MMKADRTTDVADIEAALVRIPADDREVWLRVGMAIKSELGDAGFPIWDHWSQQTANYRERDAQDVWRSFKQGNIQIGTLFYYASMNGWESPRQPERRQNNTTGYALEIWLRARHRRSDADVTAHPYAIAKGIESAGGAGRATASGRIIGQQADCIVVPIYRIDTGKVQGVQCINTEGEKQTFGSITGGGLLLGNTLDTVIPWYVCEGWASAYSMVFHHHKGNAVCAAAFGKSNMDKLAQIMADHYHPDEITILSEVDG